MKPTAPPVNRGRPGNVTGRYFFITRSTTSRPSRPVGRACLHSRPLERRSRQARRLPTNFKAFNDFAVFDDLDAVAGLLDDGARIAADERVAAQMFAAFDGLEQKGFALPADFPVGRQRRFNIGQQAARDGNQVSLPGQFQEFIKRWRIHAPTA